MRYKQKAFMAIIFGFILTIIFSNAIVEAQDWSNYGSSANDELIFSINSLAPVQNNPTATAEYTPIRDLRITLIRTYHWNYGKGQDPGQNGWIRIIDTSNNRVINELRVTYVEAKNKVPYAYWIASGSPSGDQSYPIMANIQDEKPPLTGVSLTGGVTYRFEDSNMVTWSRNQETAGRGIIFIYAQK